MDGMKKEMDTLPTQRGGHGNIIGWSMVGAVGGWLLYSAFGINHQEPLPPAVPAEQVRFSDEVAGFLSYYVDERAEGRPLLLVHSINAAASAYEMRPIFEHYRQLRPVYALDLPGFGFSERADREYTPTLYARAIAAMLDRIGQPTDIVALSLGCEFAALAAQQRPEYVQSLTLISPTGFTARQNTVSSQRARQSDVSSGVYRALSFPLWGQALYDLLTTRRSIRFFLQKNFERPLDTGLLEYAYLTTHQRGARFAPLHFVSGLLFTPTIRQHVYASLMQPILVLFDRDPNVRFDTLPEWVTNHPNWRMVRIAPSKGLPHFERMEDAAAALEAFWSSIAP
jgi:pimeloyl-ACP methyl ester carboxylesterase